MEIDFRKYKPALERQIQSWFWLNDYMRPWIVSLEKLIEVEGTIIHLNLVGFNELYTDKYFKNKLEELAPRLIEQILKPNLGKFIAVIGYSAHSFKIVIRGRGMFYEKSFTIINPEWE
ncbi:hypothetical protein [Pedobacter sp. MW01-1-1]|uniref:hypothetical protein n=1 Tax=Pedobacter sp. MW01-1-1 TaxID=3383027 RepID=UPI003FF15255